MWTATITEKVFENGKLRIGISYVDGQRIVNESIFSTSMQNLDNVVTNRIAELQALDTFSSELTVGTYTPIVKEEKPVDPKQEALGAVYKAKEELELKLITQAEYDSVVSTYKALAKK